MSHAHNTSIAKSRLGPPRFGRRGDDSAGAGPVVTYRLSEEERLALVEKYGPPMDPERAERIRMKYRTLATGMGRVVRGEENEEGGEDVMPPKREDLTKEKIESALRASRGSTTKTMAILKIGVGTFYKYIKEYGIDLASFRIPEANSGEAGTEAKTAPPDAPDGRAEEQTSPATWMTQREEPAPDTPDSRAKKQEAPGEKAAEQKTEKKTAAPEPESAAESAPGLTSDIFSAWTRVSPQECAAAAAGYVSVNAKGVVRFAASLAEFQSGDRVEFYVSPDREQLAVRKVYGIEADGYLLRQDTQSRAKVCCSRQLKSLLLKFGVALPVKYVGKWDERLQAWVGRR